LASSGAAVEAAGTYAADGADAVSAVSLAGAVSVKVYDVPFVKPVTMHSLPGATATLQVKPPGLDVMIR
jgi:hypothetical protein